MVGKECMSCENKQILLFWNGQESENYVVLDWKFWLNF